MQVAAAANIPDYSNTLVQMFKSHLLAVCERSWIDPDCVMARAGFVVQDQPPGSRIAPIEVKVSLRPPKPKTPPPKLMITPVGMGSSAKSVSLMKSSMPGTSGGARPVPMPAKPDSSKLVKITANREGYISNSLKANCVPGLQPKNN